MIQPEKEIQPSLIGSSPKKIVLDTSIQIDRIKSGHRDKAVKEAISNYQFKFTTSFGQLEFKAVVIETMITIHSSLSRKQAKFTEVRDRLLESNHSQKGLRSHIFNNFLTIAASSHDISPEEDLELAEKARLLIEEHIKEVYIWFEKSVDSILRGKLNCDRARDRPRLKKIAFDTNLPTCIRSKNKNCGVEELLRSVGNKKGEIENLASPLSPAGREPSEAPNQFRKTLDLIKKVEKDKNCDLTSSECRNAGDLLIALEAFGFVEHAMSTNAREWEPLCQIFGFEFVRMQYNK